jgi:hypothetical protein
MEGQAAILPLTGELLTDAALASVADLLRRYHLAVASFDPAGHRWPRPVPAPFRTGLVSHNDVHPANVIFRDGQAVALIDFDLAGPGSAAWDFAAAARLFAPLHDDLDITDDRQGRALERFRIFLENSGLSRAGTRLSPTTGARSPTQQHALAAGARSTSMTCWPQRSRPRRAGPLAAAAREYGEAGEGSSAAGCRGHRPCRQETSRFRQVTKSDPPLTLLGFFPYGSQITQRKACRGFFDPQRFRRRPRRRR